jgi:hypothetical protein
LHHYRCVRRYADYEGRGVDPVRSTPRCPTFAPVSSDSRTPTAHASTHQTGGSDPIDFPVDSVFGATNTITQVDYFALNTSSTESVTTAKAVWNATEGSLEIGLNSSVNALLGVDAHIEVYNQSGSPFTKGQVVKQNGSSGTRLEAALALGTSDANSASTLGLVAQKKASITVPAGCAVAVVAPRRAEEPPRRPHPIWHVPWLHGGGIAPHQRQGRALASEGKRYCAPHSLGGAGDEDDLIPELKIHAEASP